MPSSSRAPWHPTALLLILALWLATAGNLPLWRALWKLPETHGLQAVVTLGSLVLVVLAATVLLLGLFLWPRWLKPAGIALLLITASSSYFMSSYGIVIDPSMLTNVVQTDMGEALDLVSWPLVVTLLLGAVLPGIWWWRQPVRRVGAGRLTHAHDNDECAHCWACWWRLPCCGSRSRTWHPSCATTRRCAT